MATPSSSGDLVTDPESSGSRWRVWFTQHRARLAAVATLALLALVGVAIFKLTSEVRYDDVEAALADTSGLSIAAAIFFTGVSFLALTFYDVDALHYIGRRLPYPHVAMTAFSAYAVGNTAGFGALSGGAIRYRAYSRLGVSPDDIGRVIAFVTLAFGLGLAGVSALSLLVIADEIGPMIGMSPLLLRLIAGLVAALLIGLFVAGRNGHPLSLGPLSVRLPDWRTSSRQFVVTAADIAASATVLYVLLPHSGISWPVFLAVYAVAVGLGVLSHVPAGLGVFETVIIAALGKTADVDTVLGALVLYRIIYHLLPLVVAIIVVSATELRQLFHHPVSSSVRRVAGRLSPQLLATLSLLLGAMLIFSSVTPTPDENIAFLSSYVPLPIVEGAHFLASLLGLALLIVSRGLGQRLDGAWWAAITIATAALVLSLLKAVALIEASILAFLVIGLISSRRLFTRPASLMRQALTTSWLTAMGTLCLGAIVILLFVYRDVEYSNELWWQFEFSGEAPRGLRAVLGLTIVATMVAAWSLLRPAIGRVDKPSEATFDKAIQILNAQGVADANLVRMRDKNIMFSSDGRAFLMYGQQGRSWIALFDPIGPRQAWADLVWQFIETARSSGCRAVFYQISPDALSYCADAGLRAFKLGELAMVDLPQFELKGGKWAGLRQSATRGARDGLEFSVVPAAEVPAIIDDLAAISDGWLSHHNAKEKGFSLGAFEPDYMLAQPVAILRKDGQIVAFANILVTDAHEESSIDLMRFSPDAPRGAMDFLFVQLMEYLKAEGFQRFNLGMAPLSGMSDRETAPVWDRIGRTVFEHGERFYNFKGLRAFKAKFHPDWQPRYLAAPGGINPVLALMDATLLIGHGIKGVVKSK